VAVYQDKAKQRIQSNLRKMRNVIERAKKADMNEADTRVIVTSILDEMLGWCKFEDVTGEHMIRGQYADFAIKHDNAIFAIIECKAISLRLNDKHLYQALGYAANEAVEWVILTNGDEWRVYKLLYQKPIDKDLVLQVTLSDTDKKPAQIAELLYLLSREATRKDELGCYYKRKAALCGHNVARALLTEDVLKRIRADLKARTGHVASIQEVAMILVDEVIRLEVQGDDIARLIRKAVTAKRASPIPS
jgi:predicted type IV restriction endonuclease